MRVEGNEVSRLHRQTRSTGNGSLASSIKRVTYRGTGRKGKIPKGESFCHRRRNLPREVHGGRDRRMQPGDLETESAEIRQKRESTWDLGLIIIIKVIISFYGRMYTQKVNEYNKDSV